ncbi:MAG: phosphoribosylanthranilate isomerase [Methanobacteriaceae archaeon]|nr:phosphoribosylanthranilate isomerase [Methanobacteriaceae archaeon]
MQLKIKTCGITKENDIKKLDDLKINNIGFINIKRSKRYITEKQIKKYNNKTSTDSILVLEPNSPGEVLELMAKTRIYHIQLHSLTCYEIKYIKWMNKYNHDYKSNKLHITRAIGIQDEITKEKEKEIIEFSKVCDRLLFDSQTDGLTGGTGKTIKIDNVIKAQEIARKTKKSIEIFLAGGLNLEYLTKIKEDLHYFDGIDLNSKVEKQPGIKDINQINNIKQLITAI